MPKAGEKTYFGAIGEGGVAHSLAKPYSDNDAGGLMAQVGAILELLPNPVAKLLDLGCGTGWTSTIFAKRGYDVIAVDISEEAITIATKHNELPQKLQFVASDYEGLKYRDEFDCAVFFDALHHAEDTHAALKKVYQALKPGGVCVISEPGRGHGSSAQAREAVERFGVTEKDMPPSLVKRKAKAIGYAGCMVYPDSGLIHKSLFKKDLNAPLVKGSTNAFVRFMLANALMVFKTQNQGIVVLQK